MSEVLDQILASIEPGSVAEATSAAQRLMRAELGAGQSDLGALATRLCAARHSTGPELERKQVVVVAADHGVATAAIDLGPENPTAQGLMQMARGQAALNAAVRSAEAQLVLVDAGIRGGDSLDLGPGVLSFRCGDGTADFTKTAAMSIEEAHAAVQTGVAIAFSLADAGMDLMALGQLAAGAQTSSMAIVAALSGAAVDGAGPESTIVRNALALHGLDQVGHKTAPLEILSMVGGYELAVLTGLILAAASIRVPVLLDGHGTSAAALLAARCKAEVRDYLFASHAGGIPAHKCALRELALEPLFAVGLAQGEGTGAALAMPMLDAAARALALA